MYVMPTLDMYFHGPALVVLRYCINAASIDKKQICEQAKNLFVNRIININ